MAKGPLARDDGGHHEHIDVILATHGHCVNSILDANQSLRDTR